MLRCLMLLAIVLGLNAAAVSAEDPKKSDAQPVRPLRYHPDGADIVIENGKNHFNRPLYGRNTIFFVYAGDVPEIMMSLPGKGGTLWLGMAVGETSKWLWEAENVVARYRAGAMRYEIRDALLGPGALTVDVVPLVEGEGAIVQVGASANAAPVDLVWTFGGASGFRVGEWNFDTAHYCPEAATLFKPEDCAKNEYKLSETGFELRAPCHRTPPAPTGWTDTSETGGRPRTPTDSPRLIAGTTPPGSSQKIADATAMKSPNALWASSAKQSPLLVGRHALNPSGNLLLALEHLTDNDTALKPDQLPAALAAAEKHRTEIASQVRISTPDPYMNAAVPAICAAADGLWDPPTYAHGGAAWHMPYIGWRGAYIASEFGWFDRARLHFRTFAKFQVRDPATGQPAPDPKYNWARQAPDSIISTRGGIPTFPVKGQPAQYDMQQVYIDQLLWHLMWTGDLEFAQEMWPVLENHLAWEKRCFDPDDDGLYENYVNTMISDAHHYSGSPCTQGSAYNYRAQRLAARLAELLHRDPAPFRREADKTLAALNRVLWMPQLGWFAEYRDLLGLKRLHPSAELPTVYHPIDSDVPDPFQAYQMLRYVDTAIQHVPIDGKAAVLWTSNWTPYIWSVRNVVPSEAAHTALASWQAGQRDMAWNLWRGTILDSMYASRVPGNCPGTSEHDPRQTGAATDFNCSVGMFGRALVEGLFGIVPDMLDGELLLRPGFPRDWNAASLDTPNVGYTFSRQGDTDRFAVRAKLGRPARLRLCVPARTVQVAHVTVNGQKVDWKCIPAIGEPVIEVLFAEADGANVEIRWQGEEPARGEWPGVVGQGEPLAAQFGAAKIREVNDPQKTLKDVAIDGGALHAAAVGELGFRTAFAKLEQGGLVWWAPVTFEIRPPLAVCQTNVDWQGGQVELTLRNNSDRALTGSAMVTCGSVREALPFLAAPQSQSAPLRLAAVGLVPGTNPIAIDLGHGRVVRSAVVDWRPPAPEQQLPFECVDLGGRFNDRVTEIFKHEYRSPRSPYCSLQIPLCGFGDWCYGDKDLAPKLDDSTIRKAAGDAGRLVSPQGIPLATPGPGDKPNVVFTSQWDNFPKETAIPLAGRARHAWFLVAGSTHPMQSQFDNGEILVGYADGESERLALHNPTTWWPIEGDYDLKSDGYCIPGPHPPRIDLGAGRATLLDLPLDPERELRSLTVRCLANDVVVGLMSVTVLRPQ